MDFNSKIYIAGHKGMVGSALERRLLSEGYNNILKKTHGELDLLDQHAVNELFRVEKPDYIFIAAAKVGGINANNTFRGEFIYNNLCIQNNIIHAAYKFNVKKLIFLGSACIYPKNAPQPMKEELLLSGVLEPTNEPYAIAKIAGIKLCENYFRQYGANFISIMPNNLYGPRDNFDLETSHVLPALMKKFHHAKKNKLKSVEIWGTGKPLREFLHVDDMASACVFLMENQSAKDLYNLGISHMNVGSGEEISIFELAHLIKETVGFKGELKFNSAFPDGMSRKLLDISRITQLGWKPKIKLSHGVKIVYDWFLNYIK